MLGLNSWIQSNFDIIKNRSSKTEIVILCPCEGCKDSTGNRSINVKTLKTNCWKCGEGGNVFSWAKRNGFEVPDKDEFVESKEIDDVKFEHEDEVKEGTWYLKEVDLPFGFTPVGDSSAYSRMIERMAISKHLTLKDFIKAKVGYTRHVATKARNWEPYAIFPIIEYGTVVYFQGRVYSREKMKTTKMFPKTSPVIPFGSSYFVYNIDEARDISTRIIIVVESILNVLSLKKEIRKRGLKGIVPVAIFKHKVSKVQCDKLLGLNHLEEICMMFDNDAIASGWKDASVLYSKFKMSVVEMPQDENGKGIDANDDAKLAMDLFEHRKLFDSNAELDNMLSNLNVIV